MIQLDNGIMTTERDFRLPPNSRYPMNFSHPFPVRHDKFKEDFIIATMSGIEWMNFIHDYLGESYPIENSKYVNDFTITGDTLINLAVLCGNCDVVKYLLQIGANPFITNGTGIKPLHVAAYYGYIEIADFLINYGKVADIYDRGRRTPLYYAVQQNKIEMADVLLQNGANINEKTVEGCTALCIAINSGYVGMVKFLLVKGADVRRIDSFNKTPLYFATEIIWVYKESFHNQRRMRTTSLVAKNIMYLLLRAGSDCNAIDKNGFSSFSILNTYWRSVDMMHMFVYFGAYFRHYDFEKVNNNPFLKEVLSDEDFCALALVNKFNKQDLPAIYSVPYLASSLPQIANMEIANPSQTMDIVGEAVQTQIKANGYCKIMETKPLALCMLAVRSLMEYYDIQIDNFHGGNGTLYNIHNFKPLCSCSKNPRMYHWFD